MNTGKYFISLTEEIRSLKDRVRLYIEDRHWLSDGEWKESVLRSILKRHLPEIIGVGRGFVISPLSTSKQIDIILYDKTMPLLFQDGDLVFVTPDAVVGSIEVKTSLDNSGFKKCVGKLCKNIELIQKTPHMGMERTFGLFSYEDKTTDIKMVLETLKETVNGNWKRNIQYICLGDSCFIRYWELNPTDTRKRLEKWYAYTLQQKAPGYFIHNIIRHLCPQSIDMNEALWFPKEVKENQKIAEMPFNDINRKIGDD